MYLDRISEAPAGTPLITRDSLARQQWEAVIAGIDAPPDAAAWPSRPVLTWANWLKSRWESAETAGFVKSNRFVLSPHQTIRLWRRVIDESAVGKALVSSTAIAGWAKSARRQLLDAGISPARPASSGWQHDAAFFLDWNREFESYLERRDWVDPDSLLFRINRLPVEAVAHDVLLLDPPRRSSEADRLIARWKGAGFDVAALEPSGEAAAIEALIAEDTLNELDLAVEWAAQRSEAEPTGLFAVVVPDLDARREEIRTRFADRLGQERIGTTSATPLAEISICGAALNAIRLLAPGAGFDVLSRWLRSPFFGHQDQTLSNQAAALEIELRSDPRAQQDFSDGWRRHGLRDVVARRLPDVAMQLDRAYAQLPTRATPTTWTGIWQACLKTLNWRGFELGLTDSVQRAWDNAWGTFSELTPITGAIDSNSAFDDLVGIAGSQEIYEPMPLHGVLLLSRTEQLGPGFAGAWLTGFSDESAYSSAYSSAASNPLLPWALQAQNQLPGASPEADLRATITELNSLMARVPRAVFSCPGQIGEQPQTPSPLIANWREAVTNRSEVDKNGGYARGRIGSRSWQESLDPAPPHDSQVIRGGTRTLDLQAQCPLRAFCAARLGAEPLETPIRGVDPRLRGILVHRALEHLLDPDGIGEPGSRIDASIETAFSELIKPGNAGWHALVEAERSRVERMLRKFLDVEATRPPFATVAVERRTDIELGGSRLRCRIDRIDRMDAGAELIVDYKTGRSAANRWFEARLSDCQLPLYAQQVRAAGIAIVRLDGEGIEYRGAGTAAISLPSGLREFDEHGWQTQISEWHAQILELVREFTAGDVRVRSDAAEFIASDAPEHAGGAFAALSRAGDRQ